MIILRCTYFHGRECENCFRIFKPLRIIRQKCIQCLVIIISSCRDVTWHHMTSQLMSCVFTKWICAIYTGHTGPKITFFNMATLTFDLWPWPSNSSKIFSRSMSLPIFGSVCQTIQPWERWITDRQTDTHTGPILYPRPLTREGITLVQTNLTNVRGNLNVGLFSQVLWVYGAYSR